jgi:hypothetical protein
MSSKRKSFVLHKDSLDILPDLTDDQAGKLFKAIHAYQIDEEISLDQITKMVFLPFKNQFIRDDGKYLETCERRAVAGSKGGKQTQANASKHKQDLVKVADSKSKNDSKSDSDKEELNTLPIIIDKFSNDDLEFAKWFYSRLLILNPNHKKPNLNTWADVIRKMRESNGRTYQQMSDLFLWVNADDFWQGNILSPAKFHKQWDALTIQMNKVSAPKKAEQDVIDVLNDTSWADKMNLDDVL